MANKAKTKAETKVEIENRHAIKATAEFGTAKANLCSASPFDQKNGGKSKEKIYAQQAEIQAISFLATFLSKTRIKIE